MNFVTFSDLNYCIYENLHKIPRDVDLIVGIPRSGMLAANLLALYLNLPFCDLDRFLEGRIYTVGNTRKRENWIQTASEAKKVLVVDDSISTGEAIRQAKQKVEQSNLNVKVLYLALFALPVNTKSVDIFFQVCNHPRMFEWNYMHHWGLEYSCVDLDGVLCKDPNYLENDDGKRYLQFLENAAPKLIPTKKIGWIVTARLEKYRSQTEAWLRQYQIEYDHLIMMDCESAKERRQSESHGLFKAGVYQKTDAFLFIESNLEQALEICERSGKQVFCIQTQQLIDPSNIQKIKNVYWNDFKITAKRVIKKLLKKSGVH